MSIPTTPSSGGKYKEQWTPEQEDLLADWRERASCMRWLHETCHKSYRNLNMSLTLPVIVLSTITGVGNFGASSFLPMQDETNVGSHKSAISFTKDDFTMVVGALNIVAGLITTLGSYLKFAELSESNRVAAISWGKFARNITVELSIKPLDRDDPYEFLKQCRMEYDRLTEQSPTIPNRAITQFQKNFNPCPVTKPECCNGLEPTIIYGRSKSKRGETIVIKNKYKMPKEATIEKETISQLAKENVNKIITETLNKGSVSPLDLEMVEIK